MQRKAKRPTVIPEYPYSVRYLAPCRTKWIIRLFRTREDAEQFDQSR